MNFIFDLDHTVIDSSHRQLTRPDGSLDLDAWRANCTADKINADTLLPLARTMRLAYAKGHNVIICTARVLSRHDLTYLADNDLRYHVLLSRDEGDNTGDALLKRRALLSHFSGQPVARWARRSVFFDDNQGVLKMAKSLGIMTRDAIQLNQRMGA
jgi:hypothetical protein